MAFCTAALLAGCGRAERGDGSLTAQFEERRYAVTCSRIPQDALGRKIDIEVGVLAPPGERATGHVIKTLDVTEAIAVVPVDRYCGRNEHWVPAINIELSEDDAIEISERLDQLTNQ